jgi:ribosome-associated protein
MPRTTDTAPVEKPSKSALKRQQQSIQERVKWLLEMPDSRLRTLALGDRVREELRIARAMSPSGSRNRQIRLVARLLAPDELAAVERALDAARGASEVENARHRRAEQLREELLATDGAIPEAIRDNASAAELAEIERLRAAARGAGPGSRHAYRDLFRLLRKRVDSDYSGSGT